jgi:diguanylate cyclase (GGDEF)-like protein
MHALANDLLNSLRAHIAVLDAQGFIVAVNDAWKSFARQNGGECKSFYVGADYLTACKNAIRCGEDGGAEAVFHGIRDLLGGEGNSFSVEYPCHSPTEQRWFIAQVTRFSHEGHTYVVTAHEDITARKQADLKLQESEETLRKVLEALPVGVWVMDSTGKIVHGNPAGHRIWAGARYVGPDQFDEYKGWWLSTGRQISADEWAGARAIRKGETSIDEEIRIECFDGSSKIILNSAMPLRDATGSISGAIIVNKDITSRKQVQEQLAQASAAIDAVNRELQQALAREQLAARTDELTGVCSRRHFYELSHQLFSVAQRYRTPLSVFMFDVDHFKRINDLQGHHGGDTILKQVARIVREHTRESDVFARYGGDEFIVALPNTNAREALGVVEHSRERIAACREIAGDGDAVTISAGVAEMILGEDTLDSLIQRADQALYAAKKAGRNCSRILSPAPEQMPSEAG